MKLKTFEHFPKNNVCPACHTNKDAESVLIPIDGASVCGITQAIPFHLHCAVAKYYNTELGILYTTLEIKNP